MKKPGRKPIPLKEALARTYSIKEHKGVYFPKCLIGKKFKLKIVKNGK